MKQRGHVTMDICTPSGQAKRHILSRSHLLEIPSLYAAIRKTTWGGLHPIVIQHRKDSALHPIIEEYSPLSKLSHANTANSKDNMKKSTDHRHHQQHHVDNIEYSDLFDENDPLDEQPIILKDTVAYEHRKNVDKELNLLNRVSPFAKNSLSNEVSPNIGLNGKQNSNNNFKISNINNNNIPKNNSPRDPIELSYNGNDISGLQELMKNGKLYDLLTDDEEDVEGKESKGKNTRGRRTRVIRSRKE